MSATELAIGVTGLRKAFDETVVVLIAGSYLWAIHLYNHRQPR